MQVVVASCSLFNFECTSMFFNKQAYTHTLSKVKMLMFGKVMNELSVLVTVVVCACGTT